MPDPVVVIREPVAVTVIATPGPRGLPGADGTGGGGVGYVHPQVSAATTWGPIAHNLGFVPNVHVVESTGDELYGYTRTDPDVNHTTLTFPVAISGAVFFS